MLVLKNHRNSSIRKKDNIGITRQYHTGHMFSSVCLIVFNLERIICGKVMSLYQT